MASRARPVGRRPDASPRPPLRARCRRPGARSEGGRRAAPPQRGRALAGRRRDAHRPHRGLGGGPLPRGAGDADGAERPAVRAAAREPSVPRRVLPLRGPRPPACGGGQFLTRTSVLDRMPRSLCDAVLETTDSARWLDGSSARTSSSNRSTTETAGTGSTSSSATSSRRAAPERTDARPRAPPPGGGLVRGERHGRERAGARPGRRATPSGRSRSSASSCSRSGPSAGPTRSCVGSSGSPTRICSRSTLPRGGRRLDVRARRAADRGGAVGGCGPRHDLTRRRSPTGARWRPCSRTSGPSCAATASRPWERTRGRPTPGSAPTTPSGRACASWRASPSG